MKGLSNRIKLFKTKQTTLIILTKEHMSSHHPQINGKTPISTAIKRATYNNKIFDEQKTISVTKQHQQ